MVNPTKSLLLVLLIQVAFCAATTREVTNTTIDAQVLEKILHSSPVDTWALVEVLADRTLETRLEIIDEYATLYDEDLVKTLDQKLHGDLHDTIVAMMKEKIQFYADELFRAMDGWGTDEDVLIEILTSLTNEDIKAVKEAYVQTYDADLIDVIIDETSGQFLDLMVGLTKAERDQEAPPDTEAASIDAQNLYKASSSERWSVFSDVLVNRSYVQLELIFPEYASLATTTIEDAIKDYFAMETEDGLLAIVGNVKNQPKFFAEQLHTAVSGVIANQKDLIRIVVTRAEVDMAEIHSEYTDEFDRDLKYDITGAASGDYQHCLLMLTGDEDPNEKKKQALGLVFNLKNKVQKEN